MKKKTLARDEIIKKLKEHKDILEQYGVKKIGLFGSYVQDRQKEDSDIDLVVEFNLPSFGKDFKGLYDAFLKLSSYLENLFGRKVDILTPDNIRTIRVKEVAEEIKKSIAYI